MVSCSLADNPSCPPWALHKLASDTSSWVRRRFADSGRCPPLLLGRLAADDTSKVRESVLKTVGSSDVVVHLAGDPEPRVRRMAAQHRQCPPDVLERLARSDEDLDVVAAAVGNSNFGDAAMAGVVSSADTAKRVIIANTLHCPGDVYETLACDPDEDVRVAVAQSEACPYCLLERLADRGSSLRVRNEANTNLTEGEA